MIEWIAIIILAILLIWLMVYAWQTREELDHVHSTQNKKNWDIDVIIKNKLKYLEDREKSLSINLALVQDFHLPKIWNRTKKLEAIVVDFDRRLNQEISSIKIDIDMLKEFKKFLEKQLVDYIFNDAKADKERDNKINALTQELDRAFTKIKALEEKNATHITSVWTWSDDDKDKPQITKTDETPKAKRPKAK